MGNQRDAVPVAPAEPSLPALFEQERVPMLRLAALLVGSRTAAEDVVQDAFGEVARRWDGLERPGAYLRTCVVNGSRMVLRRRATEERAATLSTPAAHAELPAHLVEVRDALDRLGDRQRVVVVLRYFLDLADHEIADVLGCRRATVRSLAHRALAILREELA